MVNLKSLVTGAVALAMTLGCTESAQAHRLVKRVFDARTGRSIMVEVAHRHTRSGRIVILDEDRGYHANDFRTERPASLPVAVLGAPVGTYQTYTTYNPYYSTSYRYDDRGDYRYYRDNNGSVLGRVLQGVLRNSR